VLATALAALSTTNEELLDWLAASPEIEAGTAAAGEVQHRHSRGDRSRHPLVRRESRARVCLGEHVFGDSRATGVERIEVGRPAQFSRTIHVSTATPRRSGERAALQLVSTT
jgi:hypothetical protein